MRISANFWGEFIRFSSGSEISLNPLNGLVDESGKLKEVILEDGSSVPIKTIRSGREPYVSLMELCMRRIS